jgi:hypothetical protein
MRNLHALHSLIGQLPRTHRLVYFGPDRVEFEELSTPLGERAVFGGLRPLPDLLLTLTEADGLVAIGGAGDNWEARGAIPAKIYEYMLTERPILYLGAHQDEAARRIRSYPKGFVCDPGGSSARFRRGVQDFLKSGKDPLGLALEDRRSLESLWGYPALSAKLLAALRALPDNN